LKKIRRIKHDIATLLHQSCFIVIKRNIPGKAAGTKNVKSIAHVKKETKSAG